MCVHKVVQIWVHCTINTLLHWQTILNYFVFCISYLFRGKILPCSLGGSILWLSYFGLQNLTSRMFYTDNIVFLKWWSSQTMFWRMVPPVLSLTRLWVQALGHCARIVHPLQSGRRNTLFLVEGSGLVSFVFQWFCEQSTQKAETSPCPQSIAERSSLLFG